MSLAARNLAIAAGRGHKATKIAFAAHNLGITAEDLAHKQEARDMVVMLAGVNPPSGEESWMTAIGALAAVTEQAKIAAQADDLVSDLEKHLNDSGDQ